MIKCISLPFISPHWVQWRAWREDYDGGCFADERRVRPALILPQEYVWEEGDTIHRLNGPAAIHTNGTLEYWYMGQIQRY